MLGDCGGAVVTAHRAENLSDGNAELRSYKISRCSQTPGVQRQAVKAPGTGCRRCGGFPVNSVVIKAVQFHANEVKFPGRHSGRRIVADLNQ